MNPELKYGGLEGLHKRMQVDKIFLSCVSELIFALPEEVTQLYAEAFMLRRMFYGSEVALADLDQEIIEASIYISQPEVAQARSIQGKSIEARIWV